jgi:hypothetical protein
LGDEKDLINGDRQNPQGIRVKQTKLDDRKGMAPVTEGGCARTKVFIIMIIRTVSDY